MKPDLSTFRSEGLFEAVLNTVSDAITVIDRDLKVLFQNEAGETVVIEPGPTLQIVARNALDKGADELFRASLTPYGGRIYSRSTTHLYCIGQPQPHP